MGKHKKTTLRSFKSPPPRAFSVIFSVFPRVFWWVSRGKRKSPRSSGRACHNYRARRPHCSACRQATDDVGGGLGARACAASGCVRRTAGRAGMAAGVRRPGRRSNFLILYVTYAHVTQQSDLRWCRTCSCAPRPRNRKPIFLYCRARTWYVRALTDKTREKTYEKKKNKRTNKFDKTVFSDRTVSTTVTAVLIIVIWFVRYDCVSFLPPTQRRRQSFRVRRETVRTTATRRRRNRPPVDFPSDHRSAALDNIIFVYIRWDDTTTMPLPYIRVHDES